MNAKLIACCAGWYITSSLSGMFAKQQLQVLPRALTVTYIAFGINVLFGLAVGWLVPAARVQFPPSLATVRAMLPFTVARLFTHVTSSSSLARISLSLMHTIKAIGPLFTVALAWAVHGQRTPPLVLATLVPICTGVALACAGDYAFDALGALAALVSVAVLAWQSLEAKRLLSAPGPERAGAEPSALGELTLMCTSSLICFVLLTPAVLVLDLPAIVGDARAHASPTSLTRFWGLAVLAGASQYAQGALAYATVALASPLVFSIASVTKRIVVILVAVAWLGAVPSALNAAGVLLTCAGMVAFNRAEHARATPAKIVDV
eukprot:Unigene13728_Nuclearia_a/m.41490 Unigene13728_Nuclearia_a/g.41490  ORF Unigene13728_Nuclearia_a/g.41490 Unigene13728_Nuclearia_a/m.41490 type:complete len:320 (-) Unigene13728_Nuclearia_a:81-1040(-)